MAKKPSGSVRCGICETLEPLATAHDHHIHPRAFGGTDDPGNHIWLCASCHTRLHNVGTKIVGGKTAEAYQISAQIFPTQDQSRGRLWQYANVAARAEIESRDSNLLHRTSIRVSMEIGVETWSEVKRLARERGLTSKALAEQMIKEGVDRAKA